MYPSKNGLPTPLATLDEMLEVGDTSEKPMKVFIGHNLGNRTFLMQMPMHEFYGMSEVANDPTRDGDAVAQRKLDPLHALKLAHYLLKGLVSSAISRREQLNKPALSALGVIMAALGRQPYMSIQPVVVNIRECDPRGQDIRGDRLVDKRTEETASFKVYLSQKHVLWVVDGQHRRKAMQLVFEFLDALRARKVYPKKAENLYGFSDGERLTNDEIAAWEECFEVARSYCTLLLEVHLGLDTDQERQLFHDLNRLGKKVDTNLALHFDSSNPINLFIKEELVDHLKMKVVEQESKSWDDDEGGITRKDLVAVNAMLFLNKTNINGATPVMVQGKDVIAKRFWATIEAIPGFGEKNAKQKTVAAQPVVLKALAKLVYDFAFSNRRPDDGDQIVEELLSRLTDIDFSHDNPMWRYYELSPSERMVHGLGSLASYLPDDSTGNRDIGAFQSKLMRFGAKHNDIYPIIADMIRWRLGLPSRRSSQNVSSE